MPQLAGSLVRYPARVTTAWFALTILLGTLILLMPWSRRTTAAPIGVVDACFTATSALCVTGLGVRSTGNDFSFFGQCVILTLIQLGGIGIMTLTTFILATISGKSGLRQQAIVHDTLGADGPADFRSILRLVFFFTFSVEFCGALLLWIRFLFEFDPSTAAWHAIFHSISAFCNAGFSLNDDSLMRYDGDFLVNIVVCTMIILGGLGFPVVSDLWRCARSRKPLIWDTVHVHTKITLLGTAIFLSGGVVGFLVLEWDGVLRNASWSETICIPIFHSVTCRTAGFNTIDVGLLSNATLFMSIILMVVGGGACSTAGGVKVSTTMMLMFHAMSRFRGKKAVSIFRRTIPEDSIDRAMASSMLFMVVGGLALIALLIVEQSNTNKYVSDHSTIASALISQDESSLPSIPMAAGTRDDMFLRAMFEVASALGTVGLTINFTALLSDPGRCVIIVLMFMGRLGPLSVFAAVSRSAKENKILFAKEEPLVG